jgi:hypothetical protein
MATSRPDSNGKGYAWEIHKDLLRKLWLEDGLTLDNIVKYMSEMHDFLAE